MPRRREQEYSVRETAERLGVSAYDVFRLIRSGELGAHRWGGHWRCTETHIREYLEKRLRGDDNGDFQ